MDGRCPDIPVVRDASTGSARAALSIAFMRRLGWGPDTLHAGDKVTVTINSSRTEGRATGSLVDIAVEGRDVPSLTDDERISAVFSGRSTRTDARASSVSGTWITLIDSAEPWKWIDDPSQLKLTEAGRRAVAGYDPVAASSRASCEPRPAPRIMIAADTKSIELVDDAVWIRAEYDWTERVAYFDELTDPVYLAEPLVGELRWLYRPNVDFELVPCDPRATRPFLDNWRPCATARRRDSSAG